jgi:hypothetical protein
MWANGFKSRCVHLKCLIPTSFKNAKNMKCLRSNCPRAG